MYVVEKHDWLLLIELNFPIPGSTGWKTNIVAQPFSSLYLYTQVAMFKQA